MENNNTPQFASFLIPKPTILILSSKNRHFSKRWKMDHRILIPWRFCNLPRPVGTVESCLACFFAFMQMRLCHWAKYRKYTGTSRNDERDLDAITFNDISLFSFLYIAETALLYGVKNVVPASTLFSLGKINLPAATGSMHENNREEWWKNRSSCLETKTVNRSFCGRTIEWNR